MFWKAKRDKVQHPSQYEFYHYVLGQRFDPGSPAEVFLPQFELPLQSFVGRGKQILRPTGGFNVTQPPQVWFVAQRGVVGLGGVQAGFYRGAPLLDPKTYKGTL